MCINVSWQLLARIPTKRARWLITQQPRATFDSTLIDNFKVHHASRTNIPSLLVFRFHAQLGLIAFIICLMAALEGLSVT